MPPLPPAAQAARLAAEAQQSRRNLASAALASSFVAGVFYYCIQAVDQDEISDREESTDDEDENEERQRNKHMPDWARGAALREALKGQRDADPAQVFQIGGSTCELAAIFKTDRAFKKRTSSQNWGADLASQHEQQRYKQDMGFQSPPRGPF